jgi:hypothetical protein
MFSSAGITQDDKQHNALTLEIFGALQLINDHYKLERKEVVEARIVVLAVSQ